MIDNNSVRVRFAPSPTGYLHIGGLRTALFNWLFAKHNNGIFLIRIEDTDTERSKKEYTESILNSLSWCSINSSESIIVQSERLIAHQELVNKLLSEGKAYKCYCPSEALGDIDKNRDPVKYNKKCRNIDAETISGYKDTSFAVRFKVPSDITEVSFNDLIHGTITFNIDQIDDFIIMRSDMNPVYNFVVVADDAYMGITHVLRGEDHISNTPKQILLYQALGYELPKFGHFPLILGADGTRLSKRHAATSVIDYMKNGFLPDALCNYLVRLGWAHKDQEIFAREELIKYFDLDSVGKKNSIFDINKLEWVNSVYLKALDATTILDLVIRDVDSNIVSKLKNWNIEAIEAVILLYRDRVKTLKELSNIIIGLYIGPDSFDIQEIDSFANYDTIRLLEGFSERLEELQEFSVSDISSLTKEFCKSNGIVMPSIAMPIRLALTGAISSPGIFELISLLKKKESLSRIRFLNNFLKKRASEKQQPLI